MAVFNEPNQWEHPLGNNADTSTLPDDAVATAGIASLQKLFQIINATPLEAGGIAPGREDVNALFKYLGDQIFYTQNGGIPSYNAVYDYIPGRVVLYDNNLYKCIQANGVSSTVVTPDSNTAYWQRIDNFVRSVNGVNADANGNTDVTKLKSITLGNFTANQEVTTLDTTEGNCVLVGYGGKSHNYDMNEKDWAFLQVQNPNEKEYQKFQLGAAADNELMYRSSDIDDTSWTNWSEVSLIAEQGSNYIRYHNGIQICWGTISFRSSSRGWGTLYESNEVYENYPKSFKSLPTVTAGSSGQYHCFVESGGGTNASTPKFNALRPMAFNDTNFAISYIAIGLWK